MITNANSEPLAGLLAAGKVGTFTGLVTQKKGTRRGPKGAQVTYGDDTVHVCIFTGFKYLALVQRSLDALATITDEEIVAEAARKGLKGFIGRGAKAVEVDITAAEVAEARAELEASYRRTLDPNEPSTSTTQEVFEPLVVDGMEVRGCRVYTGQTEAAIAAGIEPPASVGTIYLQGLQVSSKVLTPAPNGPAPKAQSAPKTVAKKLFTKRLPVSRYVSYRLEPGTDFILRVGGAAVAAADKDGVEIADEVRGALDAA